MNSHISIWLTSKGKCKLSNWTSTTNFALFHDSLLKGKGGEHSEHVKHIKNNDLNVHKATQK